MFSQSLLEFITPFYHSVGTVSTVTITSNFSNHFADVAFACSGCSFFLRVVFFS